MDNIKFPEKKYQIIYADPPWHYKSRKYQDNDRDPLSIDSYYPTMDIQEIKALPVKKICDKDCACFLWVTDSHLADGVEVLRAWGFEYRTIAFIWLKKTNKGNVYVNVGPWTLKSTEICILGIKGKMMKYKVDTTVRSLIEAERTVHSRKPNETRTRIERLFPNTKRIELFARELTEGWDSWGDELP